MKIINHIGTLHYKLLLEKLIIGVEEPIFIKGVGTILAKSDSGNGAFNVLHGEDFYYQGQTVVFTTFDEEGKPHKVSKKVQDTVSINIGAGHTEERPVVLFDVKFANDEYRNVPFTIGNRSSNKNKALLGKEFLVKELDALIDVANDNIADKNIEVEVPITEGWFSGTALKGNLTSPGEKDTDSAWGATKEYLKKGWNTLKALSNSESNFTGMVDKLKEIWGPLMQNVINTEKKDKRLIFQELNEEFLTKKIPFASFVNNPKIFKILDYTGTDFANKNQGLDQNEENEEDPAQPIENTDPNDNNKKATQKNTTNRAKMNELRTIINATRKTLPILYFVLYDGSREEEAKQIMAANYSVSANTLGEIIKQVLMTGQNPALLQDFVKEFIDKFEENGILGTFVYVRGLEGSREVEILTPIFDTNETTNFLKEKVTNYVKALQAPIDGEAITPSSNIIAFRAHDFEKNPVFGFNAYKRAYPERVYNMLPNEQIKTWIEDINWQKDKQANIRNAYEMFNTGTGDIPVEDQQEIKKPTVKPAPKPKASPLVATVYYADFLKMPVSNFKDIIADTVKQAGLNPETSTFEDLYKAATKREVDEIDVNDRHNLEDVNLWINNDPNVLLCFSQAKRIITKKLKERQEQEEHTREEEPPQEETQKETQEESLEEGPTPPSDPAPEPDTNIKKQPSEEAKLYSAFLKTPIAEYIDILKQEWPELPVKKDQQFITLYKITSDYDANVSKKIQVSDVKKWINSLPAISNCFTAFKNKDQKPVEPPKAEPKPEPKPESEAKPEAKPEPNVEEKSEQEIPNEEADLYKAFLRTRITKYIDTLEQMWPDGLPVGKNQQFISLYKTTTGRVGGETIKSVSLQDIKKWISSNPAILTSFNTFKEGKTDDKKPSKKEIEEKREVETEEQPVTTNQEEESQSQDDEKQDIKEFMQSLRETVTTLVKKTGKEIKETRAENYLRKYRRQNKEDSHIVDKRTLLDYLNGKITDKDTISKCKNTIRQLKNMIDNK